jgi:hypothetical protein
MPPVCTLHRITTTAKHICIGSFLEAVVFASSYLHNILVLNQHTSKYKYSFMGARDNSFEIFMLFDLYNSNQIRHHQVFLQFLEISSSLRLNLKRSEIEILKLS